MKRVFAATSFALTLLAAGVLGANAAETPAAATAKTPAYAAPVIADADAMKAADELHHTNLRQQLQAQLAKAGYTDVKIAPSSFFIRAKDKKGDPVAMVVGPDSFSEVTEVLPTSSGTTAQQAPSTAAPQK